MKILVVEDDRKVAGFIEQGLREEGYAVDLAPDGDEATMLAHVYEYDLLVLDVMLPKKTGLQVADPNAHRARRHRGRGPRARRRRRRLPHQAFQVRGTARPRASARAARRCVAHRTPQLRAGRT